MIGLEEKPNGHVEVSSAEGGGGVDEEEDEGKKCLLRNEGRNSMAGVQWMSLFVFDTGWERGRGCVKLGGEKKAHHTTRAEGGGVGGRAQNVGSACKKAMRLHVHPGPFTKPLQARDAFAL